MIPWRAILISVLGVFTIVTMTMLYATKKIKQENILDSIREENI
jgi:putative ABC transport system permease protein